MFYLKYLLAVLAIISILASLPTATQCDTSYYEKYYSARRFLPAKKPSLVYLNFTLSILDGERTEEFEQVALVGDVKQLGGWDANQAIMLKRSAEFGKWQTSVQFPVNSTINYRYFIAAVDKTSGAVQVRRWEAHFQSRSLTVASISVNISDQFGLLPGVDGDVMQNGWLNSGRLIQFKLFRQPLKVNDTIVQLKNNKKLRIKLQAIDPEWRIPIMPSAKASIEYVRMEYGNSFLRKQPEFGVPYEENIVIMFQVRVAALEEVAYLLQLFAEDTHHNLVRIIGYQYIYPAALANTEGKFTLDLLSPAWLNTMGWLDLSYVVIAPLPTNMMVDFRTSFVNYWRDKWMGLEVGHRGLGKSLKETAAVAAPIIENTLGSIIASGDLGADLVEFDVQLTKDLIPIIYHDFFIRVCIVSKKPTSTKDLTEIFIKDVTYEQLQDLKTYQVVGSKIIEYPSHNSITDERQRLFPTLEELFSKVDKSLGFDIEIKWPQLLRNNTWESTQTIDKNLYIDRILEVVLKHGCGRFNFFTSFDADICSMLRYKQNMYPVMFLAPSKESYYMDPRSDTIYDTVNTAQAFDLAGVVPNAVFIKTNPSWIQLALQQHKKIFIWGADLKNRQTIDWFLDQRPTGVIYDRLDLYLSPNRTSVFQTDSDVPKFFKSQCSISIHHQEELDAQINETITSILSNVNML